MLIKTANPAPRLNQNLAALHEKELKRDSPNQTTLAVARKLVEFLLAVHLPEPILWRKEQQRQPERAVAARHS